jgi:hypothetical protein
VSDHEIIEGADGPELVCHAPADAACRQQCATGTCETWSKGRCQCGPLVPTAGCLAVNWINDLGVDNCGPQDDPDAYDDDGVLHYRGPVVIEWDPLCWKLPDNACHIEWAVMDEDGAIIPSSEAQSRRRAMKYGFPLVFRTVGRWAVSADPTSKETHHA